SLVPAPPSLYALSLHDALPICLSVVCGALFWLISIGFFAGGLTLWGDRPVVGQVSVGFVVLMLAARFLTVPKYLKPSVFSVMGVDRKSTRLNSSHVKISYAVFC